MIGPSVTKWNRVPLSRDALHHLIDLSACWIESNSCHVFVGTDLVLVGETIDKASKRSLKTSASRHDDAQRNRAISMQALEVLQIAVEERVLVVPFDLERNRSCVERFHLVDLVRLRFFLDSINDPLNDEIMLAPVVSGQSVAKALRPLCLAASRSDNFLTRNGRRQQNTFKLLGYFVKIDAKYSLGVRSKFDFEAPFF